MNKLQLFSIICSFTICSSLLLHTPTANSHSNHTQSFEKKLPRKQKRKISAAESMAAGKSAIHQLIQLKKIEKSWSEAQYVSSHQSQFRKGKPWTIRYKNSKASDPKKRTIHIHITQYGDFLSAELTP